MRSVIRPLLVLAFFAVVAGVGFTYYTRLKLQAGSAPVKPKALEPGTLATSHGWDHQQTSKGGTVLNIHADDFREVEGKYLLAGVVLEIYNKTGDKYDHVKSAKAEFDISQGVLYSDGDVEITMGVPANEEPTGRLMSIKTSGVHVESKTGKANTDRLATFQFDRGNGKAVGADYDPQTRELHMHSQVELNWHGRDGKATPMKVEAGELSYKEKDSKVYLAPWSRLTRETLTLDAGPATVSLDASDGTIKLVETTAAHGTDKRPTRNLEYAANELTMDFNDDNQVQKITGVNQARLVSSIDTAVTTITSDRVVMDFDTSSKDSILQNALAMGHSVIEEKPVPKPGVDPADTRILKSETIRAKMRASGQEIESVETDTPGAIEFIPNRPGQPHRWMNGERISMAYGEKNQIQSFRSVSVNTKTQKPRAKDAKTDPPPEITWSHDLLATFQPNSSQIARLEQWGDFRYQAGDRKAKADRAALDQPNNRIDLTGKARVSDATGSADADKINLDQNSGDFIAEGNVSSTRLPDKKPDSKATLDPKGTNEAKHGGGGMLDQDEPLHARARKMQSTDNHLMIRYDGNAVLWQGANRLEADVVEIDRDNNVLKAHGHVVSQLLDKGDSNKDKEAAPAKKPETKQAARVFTIVKAPELVYDDDKKVAEYKNGAILERPNMTVKAQGIQAFLRDDSNDSSLDHAFADGQVEIKQTSPGRIRNGSSEHAEYYVDEDKVILTGGRPKFIDSLRGNTQGEKLTWFSQDDRLLVNGVEKEPAKSVLNRKKKQ